MEGPVCVALATDVTFGETPGTFVTMRGSCNTPPTTTQLTTAPGKILKSLKLYWTHTLSPLLAPLPFLSRHGFRRPDRLRYHREPEGKYTVSPQRALSESARATLYTTIVLK